jgi:tetratricopeptide (TPR) repeat protein
MRAALIYAARGEPERARAVLTPFEAAGDPIVLYTLAWADSRLLKRDLAFEEYREAFSAAARVVDVRVRANATTLFSYELFTATKYEEAVRILDELLRTTAGTLPLLYERDARLNLARSLDAMGDAPAAAAELQRLRDLLGAAPLKSLELREDAQLHIQRGQLQSADALLEQARTAAQVESVRLYEAGSVMDRIEVAVKEGDWQRVAALLAQMHELEDALKPDGRRTLAFLKGLAARAEGRLEESRELLEQALGLSPTVNVRWRIEYELGLTLRALGRLDEARSVLEQSISEVELQRKHLVDPGLESALAGSREKPYEALFDILAEAGDARGALSTLQKSLARRLDDGVAQVAASAEQSVADALERTAASRTLDEASRTLPVRAVHENERDTRFVAFVATESHAWSLVQGAGSTHIEEVPLSPQALCSLMQSFGRDLADDTATQLGKALFPRTTLARLGRRFAIILPTCGRSFPVTAVRVGAARLIDWAVVSISPDVSTVTPPPRRETPGEAARESFVLGDPLADLPAARQEAEWTGRATGAAVRLGEFASEAPLETSGGRLLHFATHTVVDVTGPRLVLADQRLSVADILRRRLHADLVVLASCHSGSQLEATAAETLSTAFLRAGSAAVLATLRSVEDVFASQVVRAFYEQGGLDDPAGALARVQRQLSRTEPPWRWSAFFVAGSPQPLTPLPSSLHRAQALGG